MSVVRDAYEWLLSHPTVSALVVGLSTLTLLAGVLLVPVILTRLPADYFLRAHPPLERLSTSHPVVRGAVLILKNLAGGLLVVLGLLMLVLPGQGLLTILSGLLLLSFPGKRRLLRWLIARRPLIRSINWVRRRAGRSPLFLPSHLE